MKRLAILGSFLVFLAGASLSREVMTITSQVCPIHPDYRSGRTAGFLLDSVSRLRMTAQSKAPVKPPVEQPPKLVKDPVCGMDVDPAKAAGKSDYKGKTYYFCSDYCKKQFDANPEAILGQKKK